MMTFNKFSSIIAVATLLLGIASNNHVLAEEKCQQSRGNRLFDQTFGLALTPDDFLTSMMSPWGFNPFNDYFRPWRHLSRLTKDLGSTIKSDKDSFQINLDVQHFAPDEISVKTADGYVVIEAKHEEKQDEHGYVSRQFVRRYALPEGTESKEVVSQLSSDGILTVSAPKKVVEGKGERVVPITQTGPVRKEAKDAKPDESTQGTCSAKGESCSKA
ncbi:protein lethal(2)essential for life-like [Trichoplusia ni]|uniref:Protein lethal(2)essential for life-like n=1 Tax=Trichoplusia ni TaxID=7111 RepID=A0A7E5VZ78_TRINI|nr:protein lethal(2)essential for life-like [Trichoplusia ni]